MSRAVIRKLVTVTTKSIADGTTLDSPICRAAAVAVIAHSARHTSRTFRFDGDRGRTAISAGAWSLWVFPFSESYGKRPWSVDGGWSRCCTEELLLPRGGRERGGAGAVFEGVAGPARPSTFRSVTRMRPMFAAISTAWKLGNERA